MLVVMDRRGAGERGPPRIYADGDGAKQNGVNQLSTRLGANQDTSLPFVGDNVPEIIELLSGGVVTRRLRLIKDQVGTVELVTDVSTGEIVQRLEHDEFGRVLSDSNPGLQPFGFAGGLYDLETRLVRFGARDYDPAIGRWTARDPVRNASGANWYVFANGAPTAAADATGLKPRKPSRWDVFGVICDIVTLGNCPIPGFLDLIWDPFDWSQYEKANEIYNACVRIQADGYRCCQDSAWSMPYACSVGFCDPQSQSCNYQCEQ
jgi:RHS repeat-associated protein